MLCSGCFEEKGERQVCLDCGHDAEAERSPLILRQGIILRGQYRIGKMLGVPGGFGVTYLGYNQKLETKVAIKEYLPRGLAGRMADGYTIAVHSGQDECAFKLGMKQFLNEARLLAKFSHPNIIRVIDFFEENGTTYLVMEYHQGINLVEYMHKHGERLSEENVRKIMFPILDGLKEVHARGVLHRDIKPQNIYITQQGTSILLDFGAARYVVNDNNRSLSLMITPRFSPYEQYHKQGKQGAWTDVYGCAATMYYMLTGEAPQDALERIEKDNFSLAEELTKKISVEMRHIVTKGMAVLPVNRFQSIQEMQSCLGNETVRIIKTEIPATMVLSETPSLPSKVSDLGKDYLTKKIKTHLAWKRALGMFMIALLLVACSVGGYSYYEQTHNPVNLLANNGISYTDDAFFNTVKIGDQEAVKLFLAAGMSVNIIHKDTGETPIMTAIEANQPTIITFLISKGADLTRKDQEGRTPLDIAVKQGNNQVIKQLMDQLQVTPNSKDDAGKTLLDKGIATGNIGTVKFFIEQGANVNAQDDQGNTPLDRMLASGNQSMVNILKSAGAKRNINKNFKIGQLTEILLPYSTSNFEIDLLNNGIGQQVTIEKGDFFHSSMAVISQEGKQLKAFKILGSTYYWYAAYLRDTNTPDLICFHAGTGGFINDFKIIGKTGEDTIGILFDDKLDFGWDSGGGVKLAINGSQLIVNTKKYQATIGWDGNYFRVNK